MSDSGTTLKYFFPDAEDQIKITQRSGRSVLSQQVLEPFVTLITSRLNAEAIPGSHCKSDQVNRFHRLGVFG